MDDQNFSNYTEPVYSRVNRNGNNKQSLTKRLDIWPESDHEVNSPIMDDDRRIGGDQSIYDEGRFDLPFASIGSDTETAEKPSDLLASWEPRASSLIDDDSLAQLLADFDAHLTKTMHSLDEAEKSIEEESNKEQQQQQQQPQKYRKQRKEKRKNGVTNEQANTSGDVDVDESNRQPQEQQQRPNQSESFEGHGFDGPASAAFDRNTPTFSSFRGTPPTLQKKMVTFNDRIQTFARPQSIHDSELSYDSATNDAIHQLQQQQQQRSARPQQSAMGKEEQEEETSRDVRDEEHPQVTKDRQRRHDVQSQQPTNESGIYEDVYSTQSNVSEVTTDGRRHDSIPTGSGPEESRVKVTTSTAAVHDRQMSVEGALAAVADSSDEFLSLGSDEDEEDEEEDDDEDTDFMIRQTNKSSPMTSQDQSRPVKVKTLTVCRTLAVILAWLLAGIIAELPGPMMRYWTEQFQVTEELLSRVLATDGLGIVLGSLLGGAVSCRHHAESALAVAMVMLSCYPCTHSFPYYQLSAFLCAVGRGAIFVCGLSVVVETWQESRTEIWIHILHTAYSIGCFSAVHLATPLTQHLFQIESVLRGSEPSGQQLFFPPLVVQLAPSDVTNTTAEAGEVMEMVMLTAVSHRSFPAVSTTSPAASPVRATSSITLHVLHVPFAIVCILLALFFLSNSILRITQSFRRRNRIRKKRLQRQRISDRCLRRQMPEPQLKNENLYEDTEKDEKTDTQTDSNKTGSRQPEVNQNFVEVNKNGNDPSKNGFQNGAFAKMPVEERRTEPKRARLSASSRRCSEQQPSNRRTPKRTRPADGMKKKPVMTKELIPWFQGDQTFDIPILMFLYVCFIFPFGLEAALGMFLSVYAYGNNALLQQQQQQQQQQPDQQQQQQAIDAGLDIEVPVQLLSIFWVAFILGRVLAASLSRILSAGPLLVACLTINVLSSSIMSAYADKYTTILWLFIAVFGSCLGPLLPGGLTWANVFLVVTPKTVALAYCSAGLGWAICCWLSGFLVSYFGSSTLMYLVAGVSSLSVLLFIPALIKLGAPESRRKNQSLRKPLSTYV